MVVLAMAPHERFERRGRDLLLTHPLPLLECLTGSGRVLLCHLDGRTLSADLPAGRVLSPEVLLKPLFFSTL